jgi:hypothetical protein
VLVRVEKEEEVRNEIGGYLVHYMLAWPKARRTIHFIGTEIRISLFLRRFHFGFVLNIDSTAVLEVTWIDLVDLPLARFLVEPYL